MNPSNTVPAVLAFFLLSSCGGTPSGGLDAGGVPPASSAPDQRESDSDSDDATPLTVREVLRDAGAGDVVTVRAATLTFAGETRLCDETEESSPPQCGPTSLLLTDPPTPDELGLRAFDGEYLGETTLEIEVLTEGEVRVIDIVRPDDG